MIKFYNITENDLNSKSFENEAVYFCSDSGNIYMDSPLEVERKKMSNTFIILTTEAERANLLAPIPEKIYCVTQSGNLYMYYGGEWIKLSGGSLVYNNILVEDGTAVVNDVRIAANSKGVFSPDLSVIDLASAINVACTNGKATITLTSSYPIPGSLVIN